MLYEDITSQELSAENFGRNMIYAGLENLMKIDILKGLEKLQEKISKNFIQTEFMSFFNNDLTKTVSNF